MIVLGIIIFGLIPPVLAAWFSLRAHHRIQVQLQLAMEAAHNQRFREWVVRNPDEHYVDGMGLVIGDITCRLNAHSPYLRCAVNPPGPCESCRAYEAKPALIDQS